MKKSILFLISVLFVNLASAQNYEVVSPKGDLELSISIGDEILYTVQKNGNTVLENNTLALTISGRTLGEKPKVKRSKKIKANVERQPTVPLKFSVLNDHYEGIRIDFKGNYSVEFRVFDEGVAYRFITDFKGAIEDYSRVIKLDPKDYWAFHNRGEAKIFGA